MFRWTKAAEHSLVDAVASGATIEAASASLGISGRSAQRHARVAPEFGSRLADAIAERDANRDLLGHGTLACYRREGCRCQPCRDAQAAHSKRTRHNRFGRSVPASTLHNASTYTNWGCRCERCTAAWAEACKRQYRARRDANA